MMIRSMSTTEPSTATSSGSARSSVTSTATSTRSRPSMASATGTTRAEGFRAIARSRIARIIFIWNFVGLAVLVVGVLLLSEMRAGLTDAQYRNLRTQGELITNLLIETGT